MLGGLSYAFYKKMLIAQMIIVINFIVFFLEILTSSSFSTGASSVVKDLAFRPSYIQEITPLYTLFTSLFLHADLWHILMNMIVFLVVGIPFEQRVGSRRFTTIYLVSGVCGALFFAAFNWQSQVLLIGASGAIFGIIGAFATLYPQDEIVMPVPVFIIFFIRMPVIVAALLFAGLETVYTVAGVTDGVAHLAHIGGLVAGIVLATVYRKVLPEKRQRQPSLARLSSLIKNEEQQQLFDRIQAADIPEVREAWLSRFLEEVTCPHCGGILQRGRGIRCQQCGRRYD